MATADTSASSPSTSPIRYSPAAPRPRWPSFRRPRATSRARGRNQGLRIDLQQVVVEALAEGRGRAGDVDDEARERAAALGVPGPPEIAHAVAVGPGHVAIDEPVPAIKLAELAGHDRYHRRHVRNAAVPAALIGAAAVVVEVDAGHEVAGSVVRFVREPLIELVGPVDAVGDDDLRGPRH